MTKEFLKENADKLNSLITSSYKKKILYEELSENREGELFSMSLKEKLI